MSGFRIEHGLQQCLLRPVLQLTAIAILIIALIIGVSWYLFGLLTAQTRRHDDLQSALQPSRTQGRGPSPIPFVPKTFYPVPTTNPVLTANWKTYKNARWNLSFKYPETWFPQKVPLSSHQGDAAANFYPVEVTPHPGEAGDPSNSLFGIQSTASQENMLNVVSPPYGLLRITVAGKPAMRANNFCYIKLSRNSWIVLFATNEDDLDTIFQPSTFSSVWNPTRYGRDGIAIMHVVVNCLNVLLLFDCNSIA